MWLALYTKWKMVYWTVHIIMSHPLHPASLSEWSDQVITIRRRRRRRFFGVCIEWRRQKETRNRNRACRCRRRQRRPPCPLPVHSLSTHYLLSVHSVTTHCPVRVLTSQFIFLVNIESVHPIFSVRPVKLSQPLSMSSQCPLCPVYSSLYPVYVQSRST